MSVADYKKITSDLENQSSMLKQILRDVNEIEDNGINILNELERQKEQIVSAGDRLGDINSDLDQANSLMNRIKNYWKFW